MNITCGECSQCGGRVTIPAAWYGINPPTPSCEACHAIAKNPYGKVIETELPGVLKRLKKRMESHELTMDGWKPHFGGLNLNCVGIDAAAEGKFGKINFITPSV